MIRISGFTYVRNGFKMGYPFIQSINSVLPIVDEMIVVVGDSDDGSREAVVNLNSTKIRIIDTTWDMELRQNGKIFARQSNIGLDAITGDWALHIQADEVLHEDTVMPLRNFILSVAGDKTIDGILFPYYHFWGDFCYIRHTRETHDFEIRAFRNDGSIRSYNDSQGFRRYSSKKAYEEGEKGTKLKVVKIDVPVYHYSYVRNPSLMKKKTAFFYRFWKNDEWLKSNVDTSDFNFNDVDELTLFAKPHPANMKEIIAKKDWQFTYDPSRSNMSFKDRLLNAFEKKTGKRLFGYKNYKLVREEKILPEGVMAGETSRQVK